MHYQRCHFFGIRISNITHITFHYNPPRALSPPHNKPLLSHFAQREKKDYIHEGKVCKVNFKYPKIFWYLSFWVLPSTFAKKFFDPWALSVRKGRDRGEKQAQICAEGCKEEYITHIF